MHSLLILLDSKWLYVVLTLFLLEGMWCQGCLEQERIALLQLKSFFNDPWGLRNWGRGKENSDCCRLERVECNPSSGRVIKLHLDDVSGWHNSYLNASLFLPFEELKSLNLAENGINGFVENEDFHRLSKLSNLEFLDLSWNDFNSKILFSLSELSSLKSLNLAGNHFQVSNHTNGFKRLSKLRSLEILDLSDNDLNNGILTSLSDFLSLKSLNLANCNLMIASNHKEGFMRFSNLRNLKILDLSGNDLNINILTSLGELPSLKSLSLRGCNLMIASNHRDGADFEKLSGFRHLEFLDLSDNKDLNNNILSYLNEQNLRFVHLEVLDLSYNFFNNSVLSFVNEFSNLKSLNIEDNNLRGLVDVTKFDALRCLEELEMSYNELNQFVSTNANTSFSKLKTLYLDGIFPEKSSVPAQLSLEAFPSLKRLYLASNYHLNQTMFIQTSQVLSNLEELFLDQSPLSINFLQNIGALSSLRSISLRNCGFIGNLPTQGWCDLKNLEEMDLSINELVGILPSCLANLTSLRLLDISQNLFIGNVASSPLINLILLRYLSISTNKFQVPDSFKSFANHSNLKVFLSDFNQLVPEHDHVQTRVPKFQPRVLSLSNCRANEELTKPPSLLYYLYDLRYVDLSFDQFMGALPYWLFENDTRLHVAIMKNNSFMGSFHLPSQPNLDVQEIDISNNQIQGEIPLNISMIFPYLTWLFLSGNRFGGRFSKWLVSMNSLEHLDLSSNQFSGTLPKEFVTGRSLFHLRLSNNNLIGKIPPSVFKSQSLGILYLDRNNFEGEISNIHFSRASYLSILDISNNNLSGKLPRWTKNLLGLFELDLSNNHFDGSIPEEFCYNANLRLLDLSHNNLSRSLPHCSSPFSLYISHIYLSKNRLNGLLTHSFLNISSLKILDLGENRLSGSIPKWISNLSSLRILRLKGNLFFAEIPNEICELDQLRIMDLSNNQLSGHIPSCLGHLIGAPNSFSSWSLIIESSTFNLDTSTEMEARLMEEVQTPLGSHIQDWIELVTKWWSYTYEGNILDYMSEIDLSCNQLTGLIPLAMGNLSDIHSLNLSHNNLTGPIPSTFSNLKQLESLDLSFNDLNGEIPSQLTELNSLAVFSVAHNNLLGPIPYGKGQFGTFDNNSYKGNPLLCGPPLEKSCKETNAQPKSYT
ncbi:hypothetical protein SLEP1_g36441 [Rubroshorea leprosula]|uniref:Leucine-rich repeat-containing N-terminal plant-type domain-containing protein n=1 Tax=Rubroshorea leprosula TaxID=152421 RepID=A0AAV5KS04_9ROSI|nr:hypothetical protein SLEP1_g36441 [Rubroshorea leprosula]